MLSHKLFGDNPNRNKSMCFVWCAGGQDQKVLWESLICPSHRSLLCQQLAFWLDLGQISWATMPLAEALLQCRSCGLTLWCLRPASFSKLSGSATGCALGSLISVVNTVLSLFSTWCATNSTCLQRVCACWLIDCHVLSAMLLVCNSLMTSCAIMLFGYSMFTNIQTGLVVNELTWCCLLMTCHQAMCVKGTLPVLAVAIYGVAYIGWNFLAEQPLHVAKVWVGLVGATAACCSCHCE